MVEKNIGIRLRTARKEKGMTQEEAAKLLKISTDYVSKIEKGQREPAGLVVEKIVEFIECKAPDMPMTAQAESGAVHVPLYRATGDCGPGAHNDGENEIAEYLIFDRTYARLTFGTTTNLACLKATGDSMLPAITAGDLLIIDQSDTIVQRDACPYVLQVGDSTVVKRVHRLSKTTLRIASDNKETGWTKDYRIDELEIEGIRISGRVVAVVKLT